MQDEDTVSTPVVEADPRLTLVKQADTGGPVDVGDSIGYTITVTNAGNVRLSDVLVVDDLIDLVCATELPVTLEPQGQVECTGVYVVQASDIGRPLVNTASASGVAPDQQVVTDSGQAVTSTLPPIPVPVLGRIWFLLLALLILVMGLRTWIPRGATER